MELKPKKVIQKLESFGSPSFDHKSRARGVDLVRYSDGVNFFKKECINGDKMQVKGSFPSFGSIENGINVMMDRYYVPKDISEFTELRLDFYPNKVKFKEDIEMGIIEGIKIRTIKKEMEMSTKKLGYKVGKSEEDMRKIEEVGTRSNEILRSLRKEMLKHIDKIRYPDDEKFKCRRKDVSEVLEWTFLHDYYNYETGGHIAGYGVNDPKTPMWSYSLITHNLEDVIRIMTESEAEDYFQRID